MTSKERKKYLKQYREHKVHRVIIFSKEEYELLMSKAEKQNKPFSTMVRELALAQATNEFVLPNDEQTHEVKILLVRYGTNLNQISHISNSKREISQETIEEIQQQFLEMRNAIVKIYDKPIPVKELVRNTLIKTPAYADDIKEILIQYT